MYVYSRILFFWLLCSFSVLAANTDENIKGAACFISDQQGRILVVKDILTNKIAIPGGYIGDDTAKEAAKRETYEETGILVDVVAELAQIGKAIIFDCKAISPIPIHDHFLSDTTVMAWQAKHFGKEIKSVSLMDPIEINLFNQARFPEQASMFSSWLHFSSPSQTEHFDNFAHLVKPWLSSSALFNQWFQYAVAALPQSISFFVADLLRYFSLLGNGILFFLMIPFAMAFGGLKRTSELLFATIFVALIVSFCKLSFALPRPFYLYPDLKLAEAFGFSFPSGHTATAFAAWGLIYHWVKKAGNASLSLWLVPAILVSLSRIYLGVHYIFDVVGGAFVGILAVALSQYLYNKNMVLSSRLWFLMGLISLPMALTQVHPLFAYCTLFSLTLSILIWFFKGKSLFNCLDFKKKMQFNWMMFLFTVIGASVITAFVIKIEKSSSSSIEIMMANGLSLMAFALWLCIVSVRFEHKLK